MPFVVTGDSVRIYYRLEGAAARPTLVLSHSLGADHGMWDPQMPALLDHFRVLRYDTRGHGASQAPPGEYALSRLGQDVLDLADAVGVGSFHFCGLSLGGMTGQWIAAHAPHRVVKLALANTSPRFPDPTIMQGRIETVLAKGVEPIVDSVMQRFFSQPTLDRRDPYAMSASATLRATDPVGYAGCCAAVRDLDNRNLLSRIACPVLVIGGDDDKSTPWQGHGDFLLANIAGAKSHKLAGGHLSNIEHPRSFTTALLEFLIDAPENAGSAMRREVLGDAHVDRSLAAMTEFNKPFVEYITASVWESVWGRPGLDLRTRRLLTLTATAALGRWEEFRLHVRAGLARELEECDLREVCLQLGAYAGVPCANTAFAIASEEMKQRG